jgi:hypothetical protein
MNYEPLRRILARNAVSAVRSYYYRRVTLEEAFKKSIDNPRISCIAAKFAAHVAADASHVTSRKELAKKNESTAHI